MRWVCSCSEYSMQAVWSITMCVLVQQRNRGSSMNVKLSEILPPALLMRHADHIRDYLELEGVTPAAELGETLLSERKLKELLEELVEADGN